MRTLQAYPSHYIRGKLKIGKDFENFLVKNIPLIKNEPDLAPYYFRGSDVLKENESLLQKRH